MPPAVTREIIASLFRMSVMEMDRALCRMRADILLAIGAELGLRLPPFGGDKPAQIIAALQRRHQRGNPPLSTDSAQLNAGKP